MRDPVEDLEGSHTLVRWDGPQMCFFVFLCKRGLSKGKKNITKWRPACIPGEPRMPEPFPQALPSHAEHS